jgi:WD40 repeat protein
MPMQPARRLTRQRLLRALRRISLWAQLAAAAAPAAQAQSAAQPRARTSQITGERPHEPRLALVIGNAGYGDGASLTDPADDAAAVAAQLRALGFEVIEKENATRAQMQQLSLDFASRLRPGGVALFYYAGHGMQLNGANYLLPVDADMPDETGLPSGGYEVDALLETLEAAKSRLNIVILDACRDSPIPHTVSGLAQLPPRTGTIFALSAQPSATTDEPRAGRSLYTTQLLQALSEPGLRIADVLKQVRIEVGRRSSGSELPWENLPQGGERDYVLALAGTAAAAPPAVTPPVPAAPALPAPGAAEAEPAPAAAPMVPAVAAPAAPVVPEGPKPVLVPTRLLDSYLLTADIPMPSSATLARFSSDGRRLAVVTQDRQLRIWEVATGIMLPGQDGFESPALSPNGRYLTGIAENHTVNVLDLEEPVPAVRNIKVPDALRAMALPDAQRLVVIGHDGTVNLYDFNSGSQVGPSPGRLYGEPHIEMAGPGRLLLRGGAQSDMLVVQLATGRRLARIAQHGKDPLVTRLSDDGSLLLASFPGGLAAVYRTADGETVSRLALGAGALVQAQLLAGGRQVLGSVEQMDERAGVLHRLVLFDATSGRQLTLVSQDAAITDMHTSPDGNLVYYTTADSKLNVFEVATKVRRTALTGATLAGLSADGQRLVTVEGDGLRLYDARTFTPIIRLPGQAAAFLQVDAGGIFATTAPDGSVSLSQLQNGNPVAQLKGHVDAVQEVTFAPGGRHLVSFGKARTAKLWSVSEVQGRETLRRSPYETTAEFNRRVASWGSAYRAPVTLGDYDADAGMLPVSLGGVTISLPTPSEVAQLFAGQRQAILACRLKHFQAPLTPAGVPLAADQLEITEPKLERLP